MFGVLCTRGSSCRIPHRPQSAVCPRSVVSCRGILQPFVYVPFYFVFHGLLVGQTIAEICGHLGSNYFALLFRLWSIFMPTRVVMFLFVPLNYQAISQHISVVDYGGHDLARASRDVSWCVDQACM